MGCTIAGRSTPSIRRMCISDAAIMAPVEPAETAATAPPSRTARQHWTSEESGFARTANAASSFAPITCGACTMSTPGGSSPPSSLEQRLLGSAEEDAYASGRGRLNCTGDGLARRVVSPHRVERDGEGPSHVASGSISRPLYVLHVGHM